MNWNIAHSQVSEGACKFNAHSITPYCYTYFLRRVLKRPCRWSGRSSWTDWTSTSPPGCQLVSSWRRQWRRGIRYWTICLRIATCVLGHELQSRRRHLNPFWGNFVLCFFPIERLYGCHQRDLEDTTILFSKLRGIGALVLLELRTSPQLLR